MNTVLKSMDFIHINFRIDKFCVIYCSPRVFRDKCIMNILYICNFKARLILNKIVDHRLWFVFVATQQSQTD